MNTVAAVIVNFNGGSDLPDCIAALRAQTHALEEVLVVDNASTDDSATALAELMDRPGAVPLRVRHNPVNRGYAGGANDGIVAVGDVDAVLIANPDAVPRPDYVEHAVAALTADNRRGAVQGRLHRTGAAVDGMPVIDTTGHMAFRTRLFRNRGEGETDRGQYDTPGVVFGVSGALALYRMAMLDDVAIIVGSQSATRREIFDEDLFAYWEDVDLDWRAAMRGWSCWYEPRAVAMHERGGAGPRRTVPVERLNFRNRLLVVLKNDTWGALLPASPSVVITTLLKAIELVVSTPSAAAGQIHDWRLVGRILAKRPAVHGRAKVPSSAVVERWFGPFGYRRWVRTWWRRVRRRPFSR